MKTHKLLIIIAILVAFSIQSFAQLTFTNDRRLGINRTPAFTLDVEGTARFSSWTDVILDWTNGECCGVPVLYPERDWYLQIGRYVNSTNQQRIGKIFAHQVYAYYHSTYSDESIKENIVTINEPIKKLKLLRGVQYDLNESNFKGVPEAYKLERQKNNYGFVAQEVDKVFPELVGKTDSAGIYTVDYVSMIPLLVEALKELDSINRQQDMKIAELEKQLDEIKNAKKKVNLKSGILEEDITSLNENDNSNQSMLYQNLPNPFSQTTKISYYLQESVTNAAIYIYNMEGVQIKSFNINQKGSGYITINGNELKAGVYLYALIVDNIEIDLKRMILTK